MLLAKKVDLRSLKPKSKPRGKTPPPGQCLRVLLLGFGSPAPQVLSVKGVGASDPSSPFSLITGPGQGCSGRTVPEEALQAHVRRCLLSLVPAGMWLLGEQREAGHPKGELPGSPPSNAVQAGSGLLPTPSPRDPTHPFLLDLGLLLHPCSGKTCFLSTKITSTLNRDRRHWPALWPRRVAANGIFIASVTLSGTQRAVILSLLLNVQGSAHRRPPEPLPRPQAQGLPDPRSPCYFLTAEASALRPLLGAGRGYFCRKHVESNGCHHTGWVIWGQERVPRK